MRHSSPILNFKFTERGLSEQVTLLSLWKGPRRVLVSHAILNIYSHFAKSRFFIVACSERPATFFAFLFFLRGEGRFIKMQTISKYVLLLSLCSISDAKEAIYFSTSSRILRRPSPEAGFPHALSCSPKEKLFFLHPTILLLHSLRFPL